MSGTGNTSMAREIRDLGLALGRAGGSITISTQDAGSWIGGAPPFRVQGKDRDPNAAGWTRSMNGAEIETLFRGFMDGRAAQ